MPIDLHSGEQVGRGGYNSQSYAIGPNGERIYYGERIARAERSSGGFTEYFRTDGNGRMVDTQNRMMSRESSYSVSGIDPWNDRSPFDTFTRMFRGYPSPSPFFGPPGVQYDPRYGPPPPDPRYGPPGYIAPRFGGPHGDRGAPPPSGQWGRQQQHRVY
jgi:hypothetical protein